MKQRRELDTMFTVKQLFWTQIGTNDRLAIEAEFWKSGETQSVTTIFELREILKLKRFKNGVDAETYESLKSWLKMEDARNKRINDGINQRKRAEKEKRALKKRV